MDLNNVKIITERLGIVPIGIKYKDEIFAEFQEPVTKYMYPKAHERISDTVAFIKKSLNGLKDGSNLQMVILSRASGEFLGCAGLHRPNTAIPELGIWIKESAHGHKYGREAISALKEWADRNIEYEYIRYPVVAKNIASRKIPESMGGVIAKKYDRKMQSGRVYYMYEYRIYKGEVYNIIILWMG